MISARNKTYVVLALLLLLVFCKTLSAQTSTKVMGSVSSTMQIVSQNRGRHLGMYEGKRGEDDQLRRIIEKYKAQLTGKRIGLVFGGGGAKAAAEIGVLKVLEDLGIRASLIASSSMGSLVGGMCASGFSAKEIEELMLTEEWMSLFDKDEIGSFVSENGRTIFGLKRGDVFEEKLRETLRKKGVNRFGDTKIPFRCTATAIADNHLEEYVLSDKTMDLARAIRASLTFPAPIVGYSPIIYNGMKLVDGGVLNNLPVDVIKDEVDVVITIDLEQTRKNNRKGFSIGDLGVGKAVNASLRDLIGVDLELGWLIDWLASHPDTNKHNKNMEEAKRGENIYINPDLTGYTIISFERRNLQKMIEYGESEARRHLDELKAICIK